MGKNSSDESSSSADTADDRQLAYNSEQPDSRKSESYGLKVGEKSSYEKISSNITPSTENSPAKESRESDESSEECSPYKSPSSAFMNASPHLPPIPSATNARQQIQNRDIALRLLSTPTSSHAVAEDTQYANVDHQRLLLAVQLHQQQQREQHHFRLQQQLILQRHHEEIQRELQIKQLRQQLMGRTALDHSSILHCPNTSFQNNSMHVPFLQGAQYSGLNNNFQIQQGLQMSNGYMPQGNLPSNYVRLPSGVIVESGNQTHFADSMQNQQHENILSTIMQQYSTNDNEENGRKEMKTPNASPKRKSTSKKKGTAKGGTKSKNKKKKQKKHHNHEEQGKASPRIHLDRLNQSPSKLGLSSPLPKPGVYHSLTQLVTEEIDSSAGLVFRNLDNVDPDKFLHVPGVRKRSKSNKTKKRGGDKKSKALSRSSSMGDDNDTREVYCARTTISGVSVNLGSNHRTSTEAAAALDIANQLYNGLDNHKPFYVLSEVEVMVALKAIGHDSIAALQRFQRNLFTSDQKIEFENLVEKALASIGGNDDELAAILLNIGSYSNKKGSSSSIDASKHSVASKSKKKSKKTTNSSSSNSEMKYAGEHVIYDVDEDGFFSMRLDSALGV
ncbi:predicted protein [Chaetoceros tenuissimus]|uniref:Uncharacterized protein n=1 Tax=Chaetoceros tenuissimus TaxID=426638 RepID=A0AAD3HER7_9STRA|nr:predicted protein [Chaetoceros tenuissimus]